MATGQRALVIGGTGPTGPFVVNGLVERGYEVTILHTGAHEVDTIPSSVEHIHTNPYPNRLAQSVGERLFTRSALVPRRAPLGFDGFGCEC